MISAESTDSEFIDPYNTDESTEEPDPLDPFFAEGLITEVLRTEKSGKEGTVYCCVAAPSTGHTLLAAKVYRSRDRRNFKNDSVYRSGRVILNGHDARAAKKNTEWGKRVRFGMWVGHEFASLRRLHTLGADVPEPIRQSENAILMEYLGDEDGAAPLLQGAALEQEDAHPTFERLMHNVEQMLAHDVIHGDLSAFNVLYWNRKATIIDFPQCIDPRSNTMALSLLERDIDRLCSFFARYGVRTDPQRISRYLWGRFLRADL